jgi:predicted RNase H-like HicB family nuclease
MEIDYTVQVWREGTQFVAHAMPLDVASAGPSPAEARSALDEAVQLFLRSARDHGTLAEVLADAGYTLDGARWENPHWIGVEMHSARLAA